MGDSPATGLPAGRFTFPLTIRLLLEFGDKPLAAFAGHTDLCIGQIARSPGRGSEPAASKEG
jgi:hypothetical protein